MTNTVSPNVLRPVSAAERIHIIDVLRGFAVSGGIWRKRWLRGVPSSLSLRSICSKNSIRSRMVVRIE